MRRSRPPGGLMALLVLSGAAIVALILGVSLLQSTGSFSPERHLNPDDGTPLIRIEDREIARFHLELRRKYHLLRAGKGGYVLPDFGILLEFMNLIANEKILAKHGRALTPDDIRAERARQERESKDRETLMKIIALLDAYPGMYELFMVRTVLANERMHELHERDRTVQREAYERAGAGLKEALRDGADYFRRKKEEDPESYLRVDSRNPQVGEPSGGHLPPDLVKQAQQSARSFAQQWLDRLTPGDVRPEVIDGQGVFVLARLLERGEDYVIYEIVSYRKSSYDAWFEGELKKLKVEVLDPQIRQELRDHLKDHVIGRWIFGPDGALPGRP